MLYESWDDQAALDGNFASEHTAAWREVQCTLDLLGADIEKYTISDVGPIG